MLFDFTICKSIHFSGIRLNENGIPEIVGLKRKGYFPYPVTVSQYGIYQLQLYKKTGNELHHESAIRCAKWLSENADISPEEVRWWYNFKNDFFEIEPPWICGLAQALSSWLLFSLRDIDDKWEELAYKALEPLFYSVTKGGLSNQIENYTFLEEYPSLPPSATLNGFIYILLVLHGFSEAGNDRVKTLFSTYTESLSKNLYRYDVGYWSLYDLWKVKRLSSLEYHWIHLYQLDLIYKITGIKEFSEWYNRWTVYWKSANCRFFRIMHKVKEKSRFFSSDDPSTP